MLNKDAIITSLKLFLITAVAALCLAVVNKVTVPVISANNDALEVQSKQEVLPEAAEFVSSEIPTIDVNGVTINKLDVGMFAKDSGVCGYVVVVTSHEGYGGDVKVMVGIDKDLKVTRVKIMESSETAGLGANASKPQFIDQFNGAETSLKVVKGVAKEGKISAISSATITSKAVTNCVNAAIEAAGEKHGQNEIAKTSQKLEEIKQDTKKQISEEGGAKQ